MARDARPYNLKLIDTIPIYGISTHARRVGAGSPEEEGLSNSKYMVKSIGRAVLLGVYNISIGFGLAFGIAGLESLLSK